MGSWRPNSAQGDGRVPAHFAWRCCEELVRALQCEHRTTESLSNTDAAILQKCGFQLTTVLLYLSRTQQSSHFSSPNHAL